MLPIFELEKKSLSSLNLHHRRDIGMEQKDLSNRSLHRSDSAIPFMFLFERQTDTALLQIIILLQTIQQSLPHPLSDLIHAPSGREGQSEEEGREREGVSRTSDGRGLDRQVGSSPCDEIGQAS
jgi:hypothetical protein